MAIEHTNVTLGGIKTVAEVSVTDEPTFCPFCGNRKLIMRGLPKWSAKSLEPCDPDNVAEIEEFQCHSDKCRGRSFWA